MVSFLAFFFILSFSIKEVSAQTLQGMPFIRVRIKKSLSQVVISGMDMKRKLYRTGDVRSYEGKKKIKFNCYGYQNKEKKKPGEMLASLSSQTGLLKVGGEPFRGEINIIASDKGNSCDVINKVNMESYISGLLSKEMNVSWPLEALKAQAIAARSYGFYMMQSQRVSRKKKRNAFYDLESSEKHQVAGNFFDSTYKTDRATYETQGYILVDKRNRVIPIFYHAKCGGKILPPHQVWENKIPGYSSNYCWGCKGRGFRHWERQISGLRLQKLLVWLEKKKLIDLNSSVPSPKNIQVFPDYFEKNEIVVLLGKRKIAIKKPLLRKFFGRTLVPSNHFRVKWKNNILILSGKGLGHGVGMCQVGTLGMVKAGLNFKEILDHYFPNYKLKKIY